MPKLEIANENRYGHRNIVEVPHWDRWDTRMPDVKITVCKNSEFSQLSCKN